MTREKLKSVPKYLVEAQKCISRQHVKVIKVLKSSIYRQNTIALAVLRQCPEAMVIEAPAFWNNKQTC